MNLKIRFVFAAAIIIAIGTSSARACPTKLTVEKMTTGLTRPVFVVSPPGDHKRLFIVEQFSSTTGRIKILNLETKKVNSKFFLEVKNVSNGNEQGLLGLAFHPDYANNRKFYVDYTRSDGDTVIAEYKASESDPDIAETTGRTIVIVDQPFSNHNGGWIAFGPDGYLYIAFGDGGDANDPGNRAQNLSAPLGKMWRIDINGDDFPNDNNKNYANPADNPFVGKTGLDEIWDYGLRNPWRDSFDRLTGDLYIADVGQGTIEEVDFEPVGSDGGVNYGWRCREGNRCTGLTGCGNCSTFESTPPIQTYDHNNGRCSITGGYVYRGKRIPDLRGTYFYADYCSNQIWSFRYDGTNLSEFTERTKELDPAGSDSITSITSFGEDQNGEVYIVAQGGVLWRIVPNTVAVGDLDTDGNIDFNDIDAFVLALDDKVGYQTLYGQDADLIGDINCDGGLDFNDIAPFVDLLIEQSRF